MKHVFPSALLAKPAPPAASHAHRFQVVIKCGDRAATKIGTVKLH